MDIQLLLSSIRDQASAGRPAEARAQSQFQLQSQPQFHQPQSSPQASTFAQYLAQAGQRPEMTAPLRGESESPAAKAGSVRQVLEAGGDRALHPPLAAGANLRGMANELWGMANERASLFADSSRNLLHGETSSQPGGRSRPSDLSQPLSTNAWMALLADQTSFAGLSSSTGQTSLASQIESLSADGSAVPFAEMTRDLSNSDYQRLVAELTKSLSAEDRDALLAQLSEQVGQFEQLEQLPAEEFQALFAQLAQAVPEHQRAALLAQLSEQVGQFEQLEQPAEEFQALFAQLAQAVPEQQRADLLAQLSEQLGQLEQLPADEFQALFAPLAQAVPEHQRAALLAQLSEQLREPLEQLPAEEEFQALFAQLAQAVPEHQRTDLLAQLSEQLGQIGHLEQLPAEEFQALFAQLAQAVPEHQRVALLAQLSERLPPQAREPLLAASAVLANPSGIERLARDAHPAPLNPPDQIRPDQIRIDERPGSLSQNSAQRGALPAETSRPTADTNATPSTNRDPVPINLREILQTSLAGRDATDARHGTARGDGLSLGVPSGNSGAANAAANSAMPAAAAASTAPGLSAALGSPAWPQQLGQQLILLSQRGGEQRVELRLNPPELGPLTISLKMTEQGTQIQFLSANALVRGAVEQAIPQLRDAFAEQGLSLGETSVGEQRQDSEQGFAGTDDRRSAAGEDLASLDERPLAEQPVLTKIELDGRVDLYA